MENTITFLHSVASSIPPTSTPGVCLYVLQICCSFLVGSEQEKGTGERWWVGEDKEVALSDGEASFNHPPMCISENLIDMSVSADSLLAFNSSITF